MKFTYFLILLLIPINAFAVYSRRVTMTAGGSMPTSFSATNNQSLVMSEMLYMPNIAFYNSSSSFIACNINSASATTAPSENKTRASSELVFIPPSVGIALDNVGPSKQIYCRSDSGSAITSGDLVIHVW